MTISAEKSDYEGFLTRPMSWESASEKFERLSANAVKPERGVELAEACGVKKLDPGECAGDRGQVGSDCSSC
jgi:hypothetical protein